MRCMSFAHTTDQVRNRTKTVTRRLGWSMLRVGDRLVACTKCRAVRKKDREDLAIIEVTGIRAEPLVSITDDDIVLEGFPNMLPTEFIAMFCKNLKHKKCKPTDEVRRIEFRYVL